MSALTKAEIRDLAPSFVLGLLDPKLAAEVRGHLAEHPELHPEFAELEAGVAALALLAEPVTPPAALKARIMALATAGATAGERAGEETLVRAAAPAALSPQVVPARDGRPWFDRLTDRLATRRMALASWAFSAVALVAIVALVAANLSLQSRPGGANEISRLQRALALAAQPGSRVAVIVAPASGSSPGNGSTVPSGLAVIPRAGAAVLAMQGLAPTAGNQVYEAWGIVGDQKPVPVGSFVVGSDGTGGLDAVSMPAGASLTVALTREPGPGATTPTLPIVAAGAAGSG